MTDAEGTRLYYEREFERAHEALDAAGITPLADGLDGRIRVLVRERDAGRDAQMRRMQALIAVLVSKEVDPRDLPTCLRNALIDYNHG